MSGIDARLERIEKELKQIGSDISDIAYGTDDDPSIKEKLDEINGVLEDISDVISSKQMNEYDRVIHTKREGFLTRDVSLAEVIGDIYDKLQVVGEISVRLNDMERVIDAYSDDLRDIKNAIDRID